MAVGGVAIDPGELEAYRRELTGYCYRMLGSGSEAEDAVQETMLRAWRAADSFEGRSSVRSWLYRIATNVCVDAGRSRSRRARPMEMGASRPPEVASLADILPDGSWVSPIADQRVLHPTGDPAELVVAREQLRLAFVAALQLLPPRQRAVLLLCDVLRWSAAEAAQLLETSVAAVNSALQRARAGMAGAPAPSPADADEQRIAAEYADAFERYDMDRFVALLHRDAVQSMPPYAMWLRGADDIAAWMLGPGCECRGSRLLPTAANGCPAFGQYRPDPAGGHRPWALQVLEIHEGRIVGIHSFLDADALFAEFGLPDRLPA